MSWLAKIDNLYAFTLQNKNNKKFIFYPSVKLISKTVGVNFIFRKTLRKTQVLFQDSYGRSVYLADVDIIKIIVQSPEEVFFLIQKYLKEYLQNEHQNNSIMELEGESFTFGFVLPECKIENEKNIEILKSLTFKTIADFKISYYDLMLLISIIVDKEYIVSEYNPEIRKSRQLKKFIILSNFYRNQNYRKELETNGYDVTVPITSVYKDSRIAKGIDKVFDEECFNPSVNVLK